MQTDSLIGYRLLRRLGEGRRAESFLAIAEGLPDAEPVVLKVPLPGTSDASTLIEAEALDRARGPHVVDLLDLATGPRGTQVLVLARVAGLSLAQLLAARGSIGVGEAITVLVPIHETLDRLHRGGVTHGRVRADAVLFGADGAPVLARFGAASLTDPARPEALLEQDDAVLADRRDFAALASRVVAAAGVVELAESDDVAWGEWPAVLFALGMPEPVRFDAATSSPPSVVTRARGPVAIEASERPGPFRRLGDLVSGGPDSVRAALAPMVPRLGRALAAVRLRVWAAGAAVLVGLVAALLLVPVSDPDTPVATAEPSAPPEDAPELSIPSPTLEDDPVAALVALLAVREQCIRDRSVLCLDGVGQSGSSALAEDQDLVRALQQGAEQTPIPTVTLDRLVLEERLGDSALVAVQDPADSEPASILLMKDEAGWRIRGYLTG